MDFFIEQAATEDDAERLVRHKYGERAKILSRREVRSGGVFGLFGRRAVEVTGYCPPTALRATGGAVGKSPTAKRNVPEGVGVEGLRMIEAIRAQNRPSYGAPATVPATGDGDLRPAGVAVAVGGPTNAATGGVDEVLSELRALKKQLAVGSSATKELESISLLRRTLLENDFSAEFTEEIIARGRAELPLDALSDSATLNARAVDWIAESVRVLPNNDRPAKPRVVALVGPTGVGKTTTIAKLAAMYGAVAAPSFDVRVFTIDSYRIGAIQQIQKYGEIMGIPVKAIDNTDEMRKQLALNREADFIFIDTIGKSPRDFAKLAEVNELVSAAQGEVYVTVSATTKYTDIIEILRQFEPFGYKGVVITKLDETSTVGGIVSAMHERRKSFSFLTDGQSVPQDIERAKVSTLMRRLQGLPINHREIETRYDQTSSGSTL